MSDRTVHASYPGIDIVRYDRAGKWYLEPTNGTLRRQHVKVCDAAEAAVWGLARGDGEVFLGHHGGKTFDRLVSAHR